MYYDSICLEGGHALLQEMSYGMSCIGGVHVFRMAYLIICCVLLKDVLLEIKFYLRVCITGGHISQDVCCTGGHLI